MVKDLQSMQVQFYGITYIPISEVVLHLMCLKIG